jgi:hypothetical protein
VAGRPFCPMTGCHTGPQTHVSLRGLPTSGVPVAPRQLATVSRRRDKPESAARVVRMKAHSP